MCILCALLLFSVYAYSLLSSLLFLHFKFNSIQLKFFAKSPVFLYYFTQYTYIVSTVILH